MRVRFSFFILSSLSYAERMAMNYPNCLRILTDTPAPGNLRRSAGVATTVLNMTISVKKSGPSF
jgi:hypothetical protein